MYCILTALVCNPKTSTFRQSLHVQWTGFKLAIFYTKNSYRNAALAAGIKPFSLGESRLLWRVGRYRARSQSILKQAACGNRWLDKRAMRGQRVCVQVAGLVAGGAYVQVSRALTDIRRVQRESLTLLCRRTHSQWGERADREWGMKPECRREEIGAERGSCITTTFFFFIRSSFPETLVWTQGLAPCIIKAQ